MTESMPAQPSTGSSRRYLYLGLGYLALGLAVAGAALPLLPTTPFLLVAVWAFARSSPRLRDRLYADPRFGPLLRHWRDQRAIPRRAKAIAVITLAASWVTTALTVGGLLVPAIAGVAVLGAGAFILSRPVPVTVPSGQ